MDLKGARCHTDGLSFLLWYRKKRAEHEVPNSQHHNDFKSGNRNTSRRIGLNKGVF